MTQLCVTCPGNMGVSEIAFSQPLPNPIPNDCFLCNGHSRPRLVRMAEAGLLAVERQGRHRYHRLATPAVAQMTESIMLVASGLEAMHAAPATGPRDTAMRAARTCYDHLAGKLGVAVADALVGAGHLELTRDAGLVTGSGIALFAHIGIDVATLHAGRGKSAVGTKEILGNPGVPLLQ